LPVDEIEAKGVISMKLEKAIEILENLARETGAFIKGDEIDAMKLGTEALKAWKEHRGTGSLMDPLLLPGETEEEGREGSDVAG